MQCHQAFKIATKQNRQFSLGRSSGLRRTLPIVQQAEFAKKMIGLHLYQRCVMEARQRNRHMTADHDVKRLSRLSSIKDDFAVVTGLFLIINFASREMTGVRNFGATQSVHTL